MISNDDDSVVGASIRQYSEVKARLATRLAEADRLGRILRSVGICLSGNTGKSLRDSYRPEDLEALPTRQQIEMLVEDVLYLRQRKLELAAQFRHMSVPLAE